MNQNELKKAVAEAALAHIPYDAVLGVGTGSTVNFFIDALESIRGKIHSVVSSSDASSEKLRSLGIPITDLNSVSAVDVYVDGADEINAHKHMIKGGGAALTREKIVAAVSKQFVCIVDESKVVDVLGAFPLPVEVIPMARSYVARELVKLGGTPVYREGIVTDNGNVIIDVHNLEILNPVEMERHINQIVGVVTNGLFANRPADVVLVGTAEGVVSR